MVLYGTLAGPCYFSKIKFDLRTPYKFLKELFMQKIRFFEYILTKLEGVKKKRKKKKKVRRSTGLKSFIVYNDNEKNLYS